MRTRTARERKPVELKLCVQCGDTYATVGGDTPTEIRLAHPRKVPRSPGTGLEPEGKCPKHPKRQAA